MWLKNHCKCFGFIGGSCYFRFAFAQNKWCPLSPFIPNLHHIKCKENQPICSICLGAARYQAFKIWPCRLNWYSNPTVPKCIQMVAGPKAIQNTLPLASIYNGTRDINPWKIGFCHWDFSNMLATALSCALRLLRSKNTISAHMEMFKKNICKFFKYL